MVPGHPSRVVRLEYRADRVIAAQNSPLKWQRKVSLQTCAFTSLISICFSIGAGGRPPYTHKGPGWQDVLRRKSLVCTRLS